MSLATDLANDYTAFDDTEAVTFKAIANDAVVVTLEVSPALRRALTRQASQLSAAGLALEPGDLVWHLPNALLNGNKPKPGDLIVDASQVTYTILSVVKASFGTRWQCVCRERRA